jgi:hypothetical protein
MVSIPVRCYPVPHRGYPTPMYRPELCARPGVSAKPPLLCPSLQSPSGGWELTLQPARVSPQPTPRVYSRASALGLWGTGNRVPPFPDHRRWGKMMSM